MLPHLLFYFLLYAFFQNNQRLYVTFSQLIVDYLFFRYKSKKQGSHLAPLIPHITFPCFPINFLVCNPHSLHTMQHPLLPALPSRHLLLLKVCTRNLQYLPLNLDYENDNLISSVSSESHTPLTSPVLLSHTMRRILRLDQTFLFNLSITHLKSNYVPQILDFCPFPPYFFKNCTAPGCTIFHSKS